MRSAANPARFNSSSAVSLRRGGEVGAEARLLFDPFPIAGDELAEFFLGFAAIFEIRQFLHAEFHALDLGRGDSFHFGVGNPAGLDRAALALVIDDGGGGNAVADRELANVPVLQIGDPFVPIVAFQASQIGAGDEGLFASQFQFDLKDKRLVADFIGRRHPLIDHEHRHASRPIRQSADDARVGNAPQRPDEFHAATIRHV